MSESNPTPAPPDAKTISAAEIVDLNMPEPTGTVPSVPASSPALPENVEKDSGGIPFDPARHLRKTHPSTGRWMPKGGRKPGLGSAATSLASSPSAPSNSSPPPAASFIPATEPPPPSSQQNDAEQAAAANGSKVESVDHSDDAAEVVCCATYAITGLIFDSPEDTEPPLAEQKNMRKAVAAYVRSKGWQATAGMGILLMFAAYVLRVIRKPKPQSKVREWLRFSKAKTVSPEPTNSQGPRPTFDPTAVPIDVPAHLPPLAKT